MEGEVSQINIIVGTAPEVAGRAEALTMSISRSHLCWNGEQD